MLTRDEILAKATGQEIVELPSGGKVKVRGLNRDEALTMNERDGHAAKENYMISVGLLEPALSEEDVAVWAASGEAGDFVDVSNAIGRLSGMSEGAGKSGIPGPGKQS